MTGLRLRLGLGGTPRPGAVNPPASPPALTDITLSAATLAENSAQGAAVGTLGAVGGVAPYAFSLVDSAGSRFQVAGTALQAGSVATDFEGAASHNVTVRVTDAENQTLDEVFAITVTDVDEFTERQFMLLGGFISTTAPRQYMTAGGYVNED